jgi:hypothetical protein
MNWVTRLSKRARPTQSEGRPAWWGHENERHELGHTIVEASTPNADQQVGLHGGVRRMRGIELGHTIVKARTPNAIRRSACKVGSGASDELDTVVCDSSVQVRTPSKHLLNATYGGHGAPSERTKALSCPTITLR